jgi:hypothetical protein
VLRIVYVTTVCAREQARIGRTTYFVEAGKMGAFPDVLLGFANNTPSSTAAHSAPSTIRGGRDGRA